MAWRKAGADPFPAPLRQFREEDWPPVPGEHLGHYWCCDPAPDPAPEPGEACGDRSAHEAVTSNPGAFGTTPLAVPQISPRLAAYLAAYPDGPQV